MTIYGFNHKAHVLAQAIMARMFDLTFEESEFARQHEQLVRQYANQAKEQPYAHAIESCSVALSTPLWHSVDKAREVRNLSADELRAFMPRLLARAFVRGMIHGNVSEDEARRLVAVFLNPTAAASEGKEAGQAPVFAPASDSELQSSRVVNLPQGLDYTYETEARDPTNVNCAYVAVFGIGPDTPEVAARAEVLANILREPCYDRLRTKTQLGYIVHSDASREHGLWSLRVIIQSAFSPEVVDAHVEVSFKVKKTGRKKPEYARPPAACPDIYYLGTPP